MATYAELFELRHEGDMLGKTAVAIMKAAQAINVEADTVPNNANRRKWAKQALSNPYGHARRIWPAILAANSGATVSAILSATDPTIQTQVDAIVDLFADGSEVGSNA